MRAPTANDASDFDRAKNGGGAKRYVLNHLARFAHVNEMDNPKKVMATKMQHQPHPLLPEDDGFEAESVEAKWEHLRHFEQNRDRWLGVEGVDGHVRQTNGDASYTSITSSSSSGSNSTNAGKGHDANDSRSKFHRIRKQSWKKFKSQFGVKAKKSETEEKANSSHQPHDVGALAEAARVSTAPDGGNGMSGVIPRIRASKSMQSLEQLTRDGYFTFRDATSNLKERYHSRLELRQAKPKSNYELLWDEDWDEETIRMKNLAAVGLA